MGIFETFLTFLTQNVLSFVLSLAGAAVVLLVGLKLVKLLSKHLQKRAFFQRLDTNVQALIKNSIQVLLDTLVIIIAVEIIGVPGATIVTVLGSCGLAVGLALQGGLSNIAGGVIIMLFKPFHVGDYICTSIGDGTVEDIGVFYTKLTTSDNKSVSIPNSELSNTTVTNVSAKDTRRVDIKVSIAYDADIDLAKKVLIASAESHDLVLGDPSPVAVVSAHCDSSIELTLRLWCKNSDYWTVFFDLTEDTKKAFDKFNIVIPYPVMDVRLTK